MSAPGRSLQEWPAPEDHGSLRLGRVRANPGEGRNRQVFGPTPDEEKHHRTLENLEDIKRDLHPYGR